jgi:hypothetical protein
MALAALAALACGRQGDSRSLPRDPACRVDVLMNDPGSDYVEVGQLSFDAYAAGPARRQYRSPYALAAEMHAEICAVGGDTLVTERNAAGVIVHGTVYRRADVLDVAPPPPRPPSRAEVCEPSCGPGSTCEGGTCIPLCDPACGEGERCGNDGLCHPDE